MPILTIRHVTTYHYRQPVAFGEHRMMLRPRDDNDQKVLDPSWKSRPSRPNDLDAGYFGNHVAAARFAERATELRFESTIHVDHTPARFRAADIEDFARTYPFAYAAEERPGLARFLAPLSPHPGVGRWAAGFLRLDGTADTHELLVDMTQTIRRTFKHGAAREGHPRSGRDPGARERELPRFGGADDRGDALPRNRRAIRIRISHLADADDDDEGLTGGNTHAWVQAFVPGPGWVDFDPSSGTVGNENLVRVAVVHDPRAAVPLQGT